MVGLCYKYPGPLLILFFIKWSKTLKVSGNLISWQLLGRLSWPRQPGCFKCCTDALRKLHVNHSNLLPKYNSGSRRFVPAWMSQTAAPVFFSLQASKDAIGHFHQCQWGHTSLKALEKNYDLFRDNPSFAWMTVLWLVRTSFLLSSAAYISK